MSTQEEREAQQRAKITQPKGRVPLQKKQLIAETLRERISSGVFKAGEQIPTIPELQAMAGGISRVTVRAAIEILTNDGMLEIVHGHGTYVTPKDQWQNAA